MAANTFGDVCVDADPPRLARHRRRRRARPGRPGRQPEPGHRLRQDLLVRAVPLPARRARPESRRRQAPRAWPGHRQVAAGCRARDSPESVGVPMLLLERTLDRRRDGARRSGDPVRGAALPRGARAQAVCAPRCDSAATTRDTLGVGRRTRQRPAPARRPAEVAAPERLGRGRRRRRRRGCGSRSGRACQSRARRVGRASPPAAAPARRSASPVTGRPPVADPSCVLAEAGSAWRPPPLTTMPAALPSPVERPFTILFGSCFAGARDTPGDAGATSLACRRTPGRDLTVLCGDQVYLDTPLAPLADGTAPARGARRRVPRQLPRDVTSDSACLSGFRRIHQLATVAFTSARPRLLEQRPEHRAARPRHVDASGRAAWLDAARRLLSDQFETPIPFQRSGSAAVGVHRRHAAPRGPATDCQFMDAIQFDALRTWVHALPGPGAARPRSADLHRRGRAEGLHRRLGLPDYHQYRDLVRALASTPHDIVIVTGDVHFGRVAVVHAARRSPDRRAHRLAAGARRRSRRRQLEGAAATFPAVPVPAVVAGRRSPSEPYQDVRNHFDDGRLWAEAHRSA